jgi:hypothetical protein
VKISDWKNLRFKIGDFRKGAIAERVSKRGRQALGRFGLIGTRRKLFNPFRIGGLFEFSPGEAPALRPRAITGSSF